jgi:hypothetical protein
MTTRPRHARSSGETGSISILGPVLAISLGLILGLVVDGAGQMREQQRANTVAAQAARVAGQQLDPTTAVRGLGTHADVSAAASAANTFIAAAGMTGSTQVVGGTVIVVQASSTYDTKFLSVLGFPSLPASGQAEARIVRAFGGTEQ